MTRGSHARNCGSRSAKEIYAHDTNKHVMLICIEHQQRKEMYMTRVRHALDVISLSQRENIHMTRGRHAFDGVQLPHHGQAIP